MAVSEASGYVGRGALAAPCGRSGSWWQTGRERAVDTFVEFDLNKTCHPAGDARQGRGAVGQDERLPAAAGDCAGSRGAADGGFPAGMDYLGERRAGVTGSDGMLRAALAYARLGWPVFPCWPGEKVPATRRGF